MMIPMAVPEATTVLDHMVFSMSKGSSHSLWREGIKLKVYYINWSLDVPLNLKVCFFISMMMVVEFHGESVEIQ